MRDGAHIPCGRCLALEQHLAKKKKGSTFAAFVANEAAVRDQGLATAWKLRWHCLMMTHTVLKTLEALAVVDPEHRAQYEGQAANVRETLAQLQSTQGGL